MIGEIWCSTVLYWLLSLVIVFPPEEAVSSGLTIESIFGFWLGSEMSSFVQYHIKRTSATLLSHALLFPGYLFTLCWFHPWIVDHFRHTYHPWIIEIAFAVSSLPFLAAGLIVIHWSNNKWRNHPFAQTILLNVTPETGSGNVIASKIDNEFKRIDKFTSRLNSIARIVATDSWLIKVSPYTIYLLPQRDAILVLESSQDAAFIPDSNSPAQFLTVRVSSIRKGINSFSFRINSVMWSELERKLVNPVVNSKHIAIHQTLADRFFEVFRETVDQNPKLRLEVEQDLCIGCMAIKANVKLERRCRDGDAESQCTHCSCRPMWCLPCLSKWFAARQDQENPESWLSSRAPCPTCRSAFCLLDVCIIEN